MLINTIGFLNNNENKNTDNNFSTFKENAIIPCEFTNSICFGQTGCGKTSSFVLPNIKNRLELNHNLIVFDYKGNLYEQVMFLSQDRFNDIKLLGYPLGCKFNLLKELNDKDFDLIFIDESKMDYWAKSAKALFMALKDLIELTIKFKNEKFYKNFNDFNLPKELSFNTIYQYLNTKEISKLCSFCKDYILSVHLGTKIGLKNDYNIFLANKIYKSCEFLEPFTDENLESTSSSTGNKGVIECCANYIKDLAMNESINNDKGYLRDLLSQNFIFIINCSYLTNNINMILNKCIFNILKEIKNKKPTSIFLDEAHKIIDKDSIPEVSVCREFKVEYFFSTQNKNQLITLLGNTASDALLQNIARQISFYDNSDDNYKYLKTFEFKITENSKDFDDEIHTAKHIFINENICNEMNSKYYEMILKNNNDYILVDENGKKYNKNIVIKQKNNNNINEILILKNEKSILGYIFNKKENQENKKQCLTFIEKNIKNSNFTASKYLAECRCKKEPEILDKTRYKFDQKTLDETRKEMSHYIDDYYDNIDFVENYCDPDNNFDDEY